MKDIFVASVLAALTVASVEPLSCVQCNSLKSSCTNYNATECPSHANVSCTSFLAEFSRGENVTSYQDKACSPQNCSDKVEAFEVHVSDRERFNFESQCCQGDSCLDSSHTPTQENMSSIECPACYGSSETSCVVKPRRCLQGERCVNLVAVFNGATPIPRPALGAALVPSQDLALCQTLCTPHPTFPAGLHGRRGLKLKEQTASATTWLRGIGV
uniref:UPAR/Ly6 domain-containing protein n=1 Tax=Rhinolophus ferrumequinum TaxID=59479 RepID=A0A671F1Y1_RHIFE